MIKPSQLLWVNLALGVTLAGASYGRMTEHRPPRETDFLKPVATQFRDWTFKDVPLSENELSLLRPDAAVVRRYRSPKGPLVELAVIAGHKKRTVHTPGFCMAGGGWETLAQRNSVLEVQGQSIPVVQAILMKEGQRQVMTFFFTDGDHHTRSLPDYQWKQLQKRIGGKSTLGALVRVIVPFQLDTQQDMAQKLAANFADEKLPEVLAKIKAVREAS